MFSRSRPVLVAVLGSLLVTAIVSAAVVPVSGASPSPGPDNPWLDRRVVAVAHAGGEDETPQETLFSYGEADAAGVHVLDLDVRLSSDGVPVVIHDETVDRTTSGTGRVDSFTAAELGALDAAHWFSPDCGVCHGLPASEYPYRGVRTGAVAPPPGYAPEDFGVPTLEQVFQRFGDTYYSIEIKEDPDYGQLASKTAALIADHGLTDRTVVSAFADPIIEAFRNVAPEVSTAATLGEVTNFFLAGTVPEDAQMLQVPPAYDLGGTLITVVTPEFVQRAHDAGLAVWVWMNHRSEQNTDFYGELLEMGVDGLNVSRPALLMELLARRGDAWVPPTTTVPEPVPTGVGPILTSPSTAPGVPSTTLSTPAPTPSGPSTTAPEPTPAPTTGEPTTTQDPGRVGTADGHTEPPAGPAQPVRATPAYTG